MGSFSSFINEISGTNAWLILAGLFIFSYLLGSIPFGLLLTRWAGLGDVRAIGSGNIGATNVLRTGNKKIAALTLLCDALKGTAAVLIAYGVAIIAIYNSNASPSLYVLSGLTAAVGALLGHMFPVWLKFKGGKGVATYLGTLIALTWVGALVFIVIWLLTAFITRYSSLSAIMAVICVPAILWALGYDHISVTVLALMSLLILYKHLSNIYRLLTGKEGKIGQKAKS